MAFSSQALTANLLHIFAVTLQRRCSSTAKQLQWHCIYVAAALQNDALVLQ